MLLCLEHPAHNGEIIWELDKVHQLLTLIRFKTVVKTMSHSFIRTLYRQKGWAYIIAAVPNYYRLLDLNLKIAITSVVEIQTY